MNIIDQIIEFLRNLFIPSASASNLPYDGPNISSIKPYWESIKANANYLGIDPYDLCSLLYWESAKTMNPSITGDDGMSRGLAQIHKKYHPEVTDKQAFDPNFAINWAAKEISNGIDYFKVKYPGTNPRDASLSSYNAGRGNVIKAINENISVETYTYKGSYLTNLNNTYELIIESLNNV